MDGQSGRPGVGSTGTQPPAAPTAYAGSFIAGLIFKVTEGGHYFQGYWWWVPTGGDTVAPNVALWQVTGTTKGAVIPQSIVQWGTLTAGQWNFIPCVPIPLTPNVPYVVALGNTATNGLPYTANQFGSGNPYAAGITNGPLTAFSSTGGSNAAPDSFPQSLFSTAGTDPSYFLPTTNYNSADALLWLDVQITDQVPPLSPERAWANLPVPYPAATNQSSQRTLGMEFSLTQEAKLEKVWHYVPEAAGSASYTLWQQSTDTQLGLGATGNGGGAYTIGSEFEVDQNCKVEAIWFWSDKSAAVLPTSCAIYAYGITTALESIATATWLKPDGTNASAGDGWVKCNLSGSTTVSAGAAYYTTVFSASGSNWWSYNNSNWYGGSGGGSAGGGIVNGPLSAPGSVSSPAPKNGQGVIHSGGGSITYPEASWANNNVYADVQVTPSSPAALPTRCAIWDTATSAVVAGTDKSSPTWLNPDGTAATGPGWVYCDYRSMNLSLSAGRYKVSTYSPGGTTWYAETASVFGANVIGQVGIDGGLSASPYTVSYTSKPGSTLVIAGYFYHPAQSSLPTSITDTAGNTWHVSISNATDPPTEEISIGGAFRTTFIAWCINAAPVTSITIARQDNDPTSSWWRFSLLELTGVAGLDTSNAGSDTSGTNSTFNLPSITLNHDQDWVVAIAANSSDSTETPPSGWSGLTGGFANWAAGACDVPGVTGSFSPQWTAASAGEWTSVVAAFRPGFSQDVLQVGTQSYNAGGWGYPNTSSGGAADWIDVEVTPVLKATNRLWPSGGGTTLATDTSAATLTMQFSLTQDAELSGIWWYSASGASLLPSQCGIYRTSDQTLVTSKTAVSWSGAAGSGWVKCTFDGSVTLSANTHYKVAVFSAGGSDWYPAGNNYWSTGAGKNGLQSGIIRAPQDSQVFGPEVGQGAYHIGNTGLYYPDSTYQASNYWVDVEVQSPHFRLMDGMNGRPGNGPVDATSWSGNFLAGTEFAVLASDCWFEGYWWWVCPSGPSNIPGETAAQKFCLWNITNGGAGTVVPGSTVTSGTLSLGWNYVPLPTPVQLSVSTPYLLATGFTGNFPDSDSTGVGTGAADAFGAGGHNNGIFNGPLMAYSDAYGNDNSCTNPIPGIGGTQGGFSTASNDPTVAMPAGSSHSMNTWIDGQVTYGTPSSYKGSFRMFPNHYGLSMFASGDAAVNYVLGTEMRLTESCSLNKIWYYSPGGTAQFATECAVWNMDTKQKVAENTSPTWFKPDGSAGVAGAGWLYCTFSNTNVSAGRYRVTIYNNNATPDSWSAKNLYFYNVGAGNFFAGVVPAASPIYTIGPTFQGVRNGPVFVPSFPDSVNDHFYSGNGALNLGFAGAAGSGNFAVGPPNQYPEQYVKGLGQNYWVDMEVTPKNGSPSTLLVLFP